MIWSVAITQSPHSHSCISLKLIHAHLSTQYTGSRISIPARGQKEFYLLGCLSSACQCMHRLSKTKDLLGKEQLIFWNQNRESHLFQGCASYDNTFNVLAIVCYN